MAQAFLAGGNQPRDTLIQECLSQAAMSAGIHPEEIAKLGITGVNVEALSFKANYLREPLCLAKGICWQKPSIQTVIDIGAQKIMVIRCKKGIPLKIARNDQCALGTGRYLRMVSDLLRIPLQEMGKRAQIGSQCVEVLSTCAVFAESEIISLIHSKNKPEDILAGVFRSLASRIYGSLLQVGIENDVAFVGGVARNEGIVWAIEEKIHTKVLVPEEPEMVTAMGAALIAKEKMQVS